MELGQKKLDHSELMIPSKEFYTNDWQKFVEYNIVDVELVDRLEDKLRLIDLCFTRAFDAMNLSTLHIRYEPGMHYLQLSPLRRILLFRKGTQ